MPVIDLKNRVNRALVRLFKLHRFDVHKGASPEEIQQKLNDLLLSNFGGLGANLTFASAYAAYIQSEVERQRAYKEYDMMDDESEVIITALDIYAEDATAFDSFVGARIWVTSDKTEIAEASDKILKDLHYDARLPRLARCLAKHGDFFLRIDGKIAREKDNEKKPGGVTTIDTSYYPRDVLPIVKNRKLLGYWVAWEDTEQVQEDKLFPPWGFVHFAIAGDANFYKTDATSLYKGILKREDSVEFGQSLLKAARKPFKRSKLMHDILAISRMTRSPLKRVFKFKTNTSDPAAAIAMLAVFKKTMEKIGGIDKLNDQMSYEELMNVITQDIFVPIMADDKGEYAVDHIGGDVDVSNIADVELFDNRLFMSLRIPKEYMNFGSTTGDKTTLLIKDIRYAKRISRLQSALKAGTKELLMIHLAYQGIKAQDSDFEVHMASTSVSEDLERLDYYTNAISTAGALIDMLKNMQEWAKEAEPEPEPAPEEPEGGEKPAKEPAGDEKPKGKESVHKEQGEQPKPPQKTSFDIGYLAFYILKNVIKLPSFDLKKYFPKSESYQEKRTTAVDSQIIKFVESNKAMVKRMFTEKFEPSALREEVDAINANIEKEKPTIEEWSDKGLRGYCEAIVKEKLAQAKEEK